MLKSLNSQTSHKFSAVILFDLKTFKFKFGKKKSYLNKAMKLIYVVCLVFYNCMRSKEKRTE